MAHKGSSAFKALVSGAVIIGALYYYSRSASAAPANGQGVALANAENRALSPLGLDRTASAGQVLQAARAFPSFFSASTGYVPSFSVAASPTSTLSAGQLELLTSTARAYPDFLALQDMARNRYLSDFDRQTLRNASLLSSSDKDRLRSAGVI